MGITNQGISLKLAREAANLTQEKLSDGICDVITLAKIENGTYGASPVLFRTLMTKLGKRADVFPIFKDKEDFDCYIALRNAHFYINAFKSENAYCELKSVEEKNWANNRLYYQEWLWIYCEILRYTEHPSHKDIILIIQHALRLTNPHMDVKHFVDRVLSITEIGLFIEMSYQLCECQQIEECRSIIDFLKKYLNNNRIVFSEKKHFLSEVEMMSVRQLQTEGKDEAARRVIEDEYKNALTNADDRVLIELTLLDAYSLFRQDKSSEYEEKIRIAYYSLQAIGSCFATTMCKWLQRKQCRIPTEFMQCDVLPREYDLPSIKAQGNMESGSVFLDERDCYSIGSMIQNLRQEQRITMETLCNGLCSKSCLSKIENNVQNPDLFLAEALLQRLGLSTEEFVFYGNKHDTVLYELRKELILAHRTDEEYEIKLVTRLGEILEKNDKLMKQYFLYKRAYRQGDIEKRIQDLYDALSLTVKKFDIDHMDQMHLTWMEMTIINNIGLALAKKKNLQEGIDFLSKFETFLSTGTDLSEQLKCRIYPITVTDLSARLYTTKKYDTIVSLHVQNDGHAFDTKMIMVSTFLANVCRAYARLGDWDSAKKYGLQSYYSFLLYKNSTAERIKFFFEDSDMVL